ncbi:hypothetical protein OESDEN_21863 [Oesophagostomum dentatum]|uniref:Uncharacterized protein n=1 Tax=Oesophagostomum dentatum TaxID=61180 RepID=A0A0B1S5K1_OESDE|nr:hypothetical protein OESDEN_21863 [Oesophagostomum dentatum]
MLFGQQQMCTMFVRASPPHSEIKDAYKIKTIFDKEKAGLTSSQREANQYQTSTLRTRDNLPFDANRLYQVRFRKILRSD